MRGHAKASLKPGMVDMDPIMKSSAGRLRTPSSEVGRRSSWAGRSATTDERIAGPAQWDGRMQKEQAPKLLKSRRGSVDEHRFVEVDQRRCSGWEEEAQS